MKAVPFAYALGIAAIVSATHVWAQNPSGVPSFTDAQATRGQGAYNANCALCHGADLGGVFAPALNGPDSNIQWQTVGAVYGYMTVTMPAGNAGGLPAKDYADIMAFLLKAHGHKAGTAALTPSAAAGSSTLIGPQ